MTYTATLTFWMEPVESAIVGLRRYHSSSDKTSPCPAKKGYHDALVDIGVAPCALRETEHGLTWSRPDFEYPGHDDPRWPTHCECGYVFTVDDEWQEWSEPMYRRTDTGKTTTLRRADPGAMWDAFWLPFWKGPDGLCLMVRCPNGHDWIVDSEASNCTMPGDKEHKCWVRHGDPRTEKVTVNKNGKTCAAGAGSIVAGDYHGFLTNGVLTAG